MNMPLVSVIFLTYNRAHTLVATFESFRMRVNYPRDRLELILCDDASDSLNLGIARTLGFDKVLTSRRNQGLSANTNKGVRAASGDFILQLQDDWLLGGDPDFLKNAVAALELFPDIGMVAFRERPNLHIAETRTVAGKMFDILTPNLNSSGGISDVGNGVYTDTPHVKRRNFHDIVGYYVEGIPMTQAELAMTRSVSLDDRVRVAVLRCDEVFHHIGGSYSYNPGVKRQRLIERIQSLPGGGAIVAVVRGVYRATLKPR